MDSAGAEGPDTLPPMPQGKEAGGEGAVPRALIRSLGPSPAASGEGAWRGETQVP